MFSKILSKLNNDGHVAIGLFIFITGSAIHWLHGLDASFVAFTTTVLGFLGGHAWVQSQTPDSPPNPQNPQNGQ